jgi:myo-inositol-1-phosphate synthase
MTAPRIGIWFIGARGGVATTATLGLLALQRNLAGNTGLVTALPRFANLELAQWDQFVVGGHEIREGSIIETLSRLQAESRVLDPQLIDACRAELEAVDARIRPGSLFQCGSAIESLADSAMRDFAKEPASSMLRRVKADLRSFQSDTKADSVIVVNVASTEPSLETPVPLERWDELSRELETSSFRGLPASSLYAIASLDLEMPYINFTPSLGASPAAIQELAILRGICHAGQDGKTGETLLKSVLAPMFEARNLDVLSWVGHNIFGNLDGQILDDPANKAAKIKSKDELVGSILGYNPQTLVSIEYIRSLGDWKTAWDHIHFRGFLGTPMTLQFTWQGCDSLLAAPLVLDLVRLVELSKRCGEVGVLSHLGSFFKRPLGLTEHDFSRQFSLLCSWAERHSAHRTS